MHTRAASMADLPAIAELQARSDQRWLGSTELSEDEIGERLSLIASYSRDTHLVFDGTRLLAVAMRWEHDTWLTLDPDAPEDAIYEHVISWFSAREPRHIEAMAEDTSRQLALLGAGWRHARSSFDLLCDDAAAAGLDEPVWPVGVTVRDYDAGDDEAIHHLIYVEAAWAEVPGHPHRTFDEWRPIFVTKETLTEQQHIAVRDGRIVGVAMGRTWDDGTGWVSQLAVARSERGRGLGRALLLASLRARRDAGARSLGLSVEAENRAALGMYLSAGMRIEREYQTYQPADAT